MKEFWIRDQELNYGPTKGAKFVAFETPDVEGEGIIHVVEHEAVKLLEQKLGIAWNALQEVKESGIVDCPECNAHERIVEQALSRIEAVGK